MIMFKAEKEESTIEIKGFNADIIFELAGLVDAIKSDERIIRLLSKAVVLREVASDMEGEKNHDKQSNSDRAIN